MWYIFRYVADFGLFLFGMNIPPGSGITFPYKPTGLFWSIAVIPLIRKPFKYANSPWKYVFKKLQKTSIMQ